MPFGLRNALATFQRYMTVVLAPCAAFTIVYMDDVLIHSSSEQEHREHVDQVFAVLREKQLKVKQAKCEFFRQKISFLGHQVSGGQITMDEGKRVAIVRWKSLLFDARQVRQFVGLASYYRTFIPKFSTIMEPLTTLTRKRSKFAWTWEAEQAMRQIQELMEQVSICWVWNEERQTRVVTDASGVGIGAILEQWNTEQGAWVMVAAWSRILTPCQRRYSVTDKEWLAVVDCVTRVWKHWLLGREFEVLTDHAPLRQLLTTKGEDFTYRQLRWFEKLEPYSFRVQYIKGSDNKVADALSRTPSFQISAVENAASEPKLDDEAFSKAVQTDSDYKEVLHDRELCAQLQLTRHELGLLQRADGTIWVPDDPVLRYKIVLEAHEPPFSGHFGRTRTEAEVRKRWWWHELHHTVEQVVSTCDVCQRDQFKTRKDAAPFRGLEAKYPWEIVTIDFLSGFTPAPRTRHTACCVVCDRFSRMVHVVSCRDHCTARDTVQLVLRMIVAAHGCPRVIVSDRGTQFDSAVWRELWEMTGTRVAMASTHHPQTNGIIERMNRTLISMICKYTQRVGGRWAELLPLFELAYNRSRHEQTQVTPFSVVYGEDPPVPLDFLSGNSRIAEGVQESEHAQERRDVLKVIHQLLQERHVQQARQIKDWEDSKRGKPQYFPGDEVLVYWPQFAPRTALVRKQRLRYEGPFEVEEVLSNTVLRLRGLPSKMSPLINVEFVHLYKRSPDCHLEQLRGEPES